MTYIEDQRGLEPREAADCLGDEIGVGRVDFALDAQDRGQAAGVNTHARPGAIDLVAAARFPASAWWSWSSHMLAPLKGDGEQGE